jgi:membrane protease subunit HflC
MQAYDAGLPQSDTRFVVKPDSEFFRYFLDPSGKTRPANPAASAAPSTPPSAAR